LNEAREIVAEMQFVYPALFKDDLSSGYGFGGHNGVKGLATRLVDAFRARSFGKSRGWNRRGKKKTVYGVNNFLWYMAKGPGSGSDSLINLLSNNYYRTYAGREKLFENHRSELTALLRDYQDSISGVCRQFFSDHRHLETQFMYLTSTLGLTRVVENNISKEMTNLEVYLGYTAGVAIPNTGSGLECKYVDIIRKSCELFDSDVAGLVRVVSDPPIPDNSPCIVALEGSKGLSFELWACKEKLLNDLTMAQAIASFLHLAFVCNLLYPRTGQTVADILQRRFALYGDYSATRTHFNLEHSMTKYKRYVHTLDNIIFTK